jgi:nucleoside 2-deoxyribosyltransferase
MRTIKPLKNLRRVYCAGPLFNQGERGEMCRVAAALQSHGFETFLPHADGMEFANVLPVLVRWGWMPAEAGRLLHQAIFALDTYQVILGCGSLVFNCNGRVPDEGAVAEATMAWMLGKPVVIYKDDVRSMISGRDNPLVVGQTGFEVVDRLERLAAVLEDKIAAVADEVHRETACPCVPSMSSGTGHERHSRAAGSRRTRRPARLDPHSARTRRPLDSAGASAHRCS